MRALAVEAGREQLLGEQRVALAAGEQAVDEVVLRRRAEDVLEQRRRAPRASASTSSMRRAFGRALELGQQRSQRVAAVQLVGAVGGDDERRARSRGCAPGTRGTRASSGRPSGCPPATASAARRARGARSATAAPRRRAAAPASSRSRASARARRRAAPSSGSSVASSDAGRRRQLGDRRVALARERAQHRDERRVGELVLAELDAVARLDANAALLRAAAQLLHEARLADARFARDEGERGPAVGRVRDRALELGRARRGGRSAACW